MSSPQMTRMLGLLVSAISSSFLRLLTSRTGRPPGRTERRDRARPSPRIKIAPELNNWTKVLHAASAFQGSPYGTKVQFLRIAPGFKIVLIGEGERLELAENFAAVAVGWIK